MAGLLRDRYFEYAPNRAWDLVTGEAMSPGADEDEARSSASGSGPLIELLDHGTDGSPRWMVTHAADADWRTRSRAAATEARRRGYVPMAVEIFLRTRLLLVDDLSTRTFMLIARPDTPFERLRTALLHAAAMSPGPHVLMTLAGGRRGRAVAGWRAAEARAVYGATRLPPVSTPGTSADVVRLIERAGRASEFVQVGRHAAAERLLREVAASLARRRASTSAADTYIALGRILLERGRVAAADAAFGEAAVQAEGADVRLVVSARIRQAAARTDAGQLTAAESLCRAALITAPPDDEHGPRAEATLARVLLWQGRAAEAAALPFVLSATPSLPPFVEAAAIRVLVETGKLFEAGRRARALLDRTAEGGGTTRVIALGAHLRVLLAAGDLRLAEDQLRACGAAAREARTPLRFARLRLQWSHALRRAGKTGDADRELRTLSRMRSAMPPLLRSAIDRCVKTPISAHPAGPPRPSIVPGDAAALVVLAQREGDDGEAMKRIGEFLLRGVRATRVEFWTADAGPATAVVATGSGLPTQLGRRALEAGTMIGPEFVESGWEMAAPVRLGSRLIGALAVRWPGDRSPSDESAALLNVACAVAAPRIDSWSHAARQHTQAATAIPELVGVSGAMADVRRAVVRAAAAPFAVLIEGAIRR